MRKSKLFIFVIAIALIIMGTGYAAWSQTFSVAATVSTGELDLNIDHPSEEAMEHWPGSPGVHYGSDYIEIKSGPTEDLKGFNVVITDIYPGAYGAFIYVIENVGTVPAKISEITIEIDADAEFIDQMTFNSGFHRYNNDEYQGTLAYASGSLLAMESLWNAHLVGQSIEPGEMIVVGDSKYSQILKGVRLNMLSSAPDNLEETQLEMNIKIDFVQDTE